MGKPDRRTHKNYNGRTRSLEEFPTCRDKCFSDISCFEDIRAQLSNWGSNSSCSKVGINGSIEGSFGRNVQLINIPVHGKGENSYEIWCICREVVKPPGGHGGVDRDSEDRELTPTPENPGLSLENGSNSSTPTPEDELVNGVVENGVLSDDEGDKDDVFQVNGDLDKTNSGNKIVENCSRGHNCGKAKCKSSSPSKCRSCTAADEDNKLSEDELSNLRELFDKLNEIKETGGAAADMERDLTLKMNGHTPSVPETPTSVLDTPLSAMDSASVCSFDHFDFDSFSLKSTDTMEQSDLADQLSLVQQMVMEMKTGFARAMEELAKIQYGDQTLQQQLADNKKECTDEISHVKTSVDELKAEVHRLNNQVQEISDAQRSLQDRVESYQSEKLILLEELERNGVISDQTRVRLSGGSLQETNNNVPEIPVGPMVHPYLNSLQAHHHHHRGQEDLYHSDSSLTAAVSRSLNLTQALGEKCLNLDFSTTSSDDEDNSRHSHQSGSGHNKPIRRHRSFQREESARDIVEAEREYCTQLWALLQDFMSPVREAQLVSPRDFHFLFPAYVPQLYEQHCVMLRKLEDRLKKWKYTGVLGDIFAKFTETQEGDGLSLYKDFINDFPNVIGTMNKWFTHSPHFRELLQSSCLANSPVLPLLLAPLQQVPKYSLLLKGLLKYTPADHPDRYYLESSLNRLKHFLNEMNDDLEHAMQVINSNSQPITSRPREFGHSGHSKSSGSSTEANHVSRDSGIHSNEEEREKSPLSPNTTRRYLVQVLREKRERELYQAQGKQDGRPPTPRSRKELDYGSHPDLTHHPPGYQDGRVSPYLASLPQSKMFSSLSKLPLPRDKPKASRTNKGPPINTNYLRPLTPQVFPTSTSAHSFESARRRDELADRARRRPASAVEFAYSGQGDRADHFYDILAQQAGLAVSPPHSSSSDKSRRDLQLSLHKLLVETNNAEDYSDNEQDDLDGTQYPSYHKEFLATKDKIMNQQADGDYKRKFSDSPSVEDYGIYGDDDDDDDGNDENTSKVRPMRLLPDTHRPKIMVPRWRQNASPQPPSYSRTVDNMNKPKKSSKSEENLAASLAQSLLESKPSNQTVTSGTEQRGEATNRTGSAIPTSSNSLKRRLNSADTPKVSSSEPRRSLSDKLSPSVSGSGPTRPTDLKLSSNKGNSGRTVPLNVEQSEEGNKNSATTNMQRPSSVTKLSDVIAYTADCIEKKESNADDSNSDNTDSPARPASFSAGNSSKEGKKGKKISLSDASKHLKVSSVDADCSSMSASDSDTGSKPKPKSEFKIAFAVSPSALPVSKSPANTESVVNYFQNKGQMNQERAQPITDSPDKTNRVPTFISMDKTSTPVSDNPFQMNTAKSKDTFQGFSKKESGRLVRGDNIKPEKSEAAKGETVDDKERSDDSKGETEGATKESVLRAVDKLRLDLERQKQHSEERKLNKNSSLTPSSSVEPSSPTSPVTPTSATIQGHFNELSKYTRPITPDQKPLTLTTFSSSQRQSGDSNASSSDTDSKTTSDQLEPRQGLYRKAGQLKAPAKYPTDSAASARHIQKLERSTSPLGRSVSPNSHTNDYEKFKSQVESSNVSRPQKRGSSPHRGIKGVFAPTRSKSPTVAISGSKERPKSTTGLPTRSIQLEVNGEGQPLKSAMKDTKIPVLKKSTSPTNLLSKSSEDISKLKKKSAFKDQLKNIFGRKKKRSKLYSTSYDPDEAYNNHVTIDPEPSSFSRVDDEGFYPLTPERRANSTSQILQNYTFEDEDVFDEDPISSV